MADEEMLTVREACAYMRISYSTLYRLTRAKRIRKYEIGARGQRFMGRFRHGKVLYRKSELDEFLRTCRR